jgi:hypothetical protein
VVHDQPDRNKTDESGQVLDFRPRRRARPQPFRGQGNPSGKRDVELDDDLAGYEQEPDEPLDYRKRMLMNVIAIVIVTLLVGIGVWLADTIAELQKDQDCVLQGRANCAPIETTVPPK